MKALIYKYTDSEIKQILKSITILVDTREQKNQWVLDYFISKKINFKNHSLEFADYSFMIPANPELGILKDVYFDKEIVVERKANLEELSKNLAQRREQFSNEFLRSKDCRKFLLIEKGSYVDILEHKYNTEFKTESFFGSVLSFEHKFNLQVVFLKKEWSGKYIYAQFYYYLRERLS